MQACDPRCYWYNATVIETSGTGKKTKVKVHYRGWKASLDEWFCARDEGLRVPIPDKDLLEERASLIYQGNTSTRNADGTWEAERIIKIRQRRKGPLEALVRWVSFGSDADTWEKYEGLPTALVEEFEEERAAKQAALDEEREAKAAARAKRKQPKPKPPPYSTTLASAESAEIQAQRVADAAELEGALAPEARVRVSRQKGPSSEVRLFAAKPFGAGPFHGLRERCYRIARNANEDRDLDQAVTPVSAHRRGQRPVDTFSVMDDEVVNALVGAGVMHIHAATTGAAVKLVPPLDFFLRARLDEAGAPCAAKELTVKGHFAALVPNHGDPGRPIFRLDDEGFKYPDTDRHAYKQAVAKRLLDVSADEHVPAEFVAWAQTVPLA